MHIIMGKTDTILVFGAIAIVAIALITKKNTLCDSGSNTKPFNIPISIALDAAGENLYVANWRETGAEKGSDILKFNLKTRKVKNLGSKASPPFNLSTHVAVDNQCNVYVTDTGNALVRRIDAKTGDVTNLGELAEPKIVNPVNLALDNKGNVYVSDYETDTIRKIAPSGEVITLGISADPPFNRVQGLALDNDGNLYVADSENNMVRKINAKDDSVENITFLNGTPLSVPIGLVVDKSGSHLYVTDTGNDLVRKIDIANKSIENLGEFADPKFGSPVSITVDKKGNVYVTDTFYKSVRRIDAITDEVTDV